MAPRPAVPPRLHADVHVYGRLAELARRRHRKHGKTTAATATSIALLANLRASSLGERRPSDHEMSSGAWDKVYNAHTQWVLSLIHI